MSDSVDPPRMKVDVLGCVRATPIARERAFLPVFEAVVNAIHSTDDRFGEDVGRLGCVDVVVRRSAQEALPGAAGKTALQAIESARVEDNGCGFTQRNMESFETAYSTAKADRGGKGVGRFSWLAVFRHAGITSVYLADGELRSRRFNFRATKLGVPAQTF